MTETRRKSHWKPGQSGNPAGRKPGSGEVAKLRSQIAGHVPGIVTALVKKALAGDASAARLLLERVLPPVRPVEEPTPIEMPADASLAEQGREVLKATAAGALAPGQASQLLAALGSVAKLIETDELAARIAALEVKHGNKS